MSWTAEQVTQLRALHGGGFDVLADRQTDRRVVQQCDRQSQAFGIGRAPDRALHWQAAWTQGVPAALRAASRCQEARPRTGAHRDQSRRHHRFGIPSLQMANHRRSAMAALRGETCAALGLLRATRSAGGAACILTAQARCGNRPSGAGEWDETGVRLMTRHLLDVAGDFCRFPHWEDDNLRTHTGRLVVCGEPGYPYCADHRAIVHMRRDEREKELAAMRRATWQNCLQVGSR